MEIIFSNALFEVAVTNEGYEVINKKTKVVEFRTTIITQALYQAESVLEVLSSRFPELLKESLDSLEE